MTDELARDRETDKDGMGRVQKLTLPSRARGQIMRRHKHILRKPTRHDGGLTCLQSIATLVWMRAQRTPDRAPRSHRRPRTLPVLKVGRPRSCKRQQRPRQPPWLTRPVVFTWCEVSVLRSTRTLQQPSAERLATRLAKQPCNSVCRGSVSVSCYRHRSSCTYISPACCCCCHSPGGCSRHLHPAAFPYCLPHASHARARAPPALTQSVRVFMRGIQLCCSRHFCSSSSLSAHQAPKRLHCVCGEGG
jgi:hypothetical protein